MPKTLKNGLPWYDTNGNVIHAHGGHIVKFGGIYYWYGENREDNIYVSCYSSNDLMNWRFENNILTTNSKTEDIGISKDLSLVNSSKKVNIERPKIVFNEKTQKYIMWAHYENGENYSCSAIALASSDTPTGDFTYHGNFRPFGHMSRDCNVFEYENKMYFISAANTNADLHIYQMTDDYLGVKEQVNKLFIGEYREAPALFTHENRIYMLTSECTGWCPNQGGYSSAEDIKGEWQSIKPFGDDKTYHSQPTSVLTLETMGKTQYIYIGDRWGGNQWDGVDRSYFKYSNSSYYFGLIEIDEKGNLVLMPCEEFEIDMQKGFKTI